LPPTSRSTETSDEDRARGAAGTVDGDGPGAALRGSSEPDLHLEEAVSGSAARAFDQGVARCAETAHEREIERLHAKIGQLTVEAVFLARRSRR
jgi:hypothetical protein